MVSDLDDLRDRFDAILLDLDGTLLDGQSELTPRTARAVRKLVEAGFLVALCTGRSVAGTRPFHTALGLDSHLIAFNGSWIGPPDGQPVHYIPIDDTHLEALFRAEDEAFFSFRHRDDQKYTVMTDHPDHHRVAEWYENVVRAAHPVELPASDIIRVSMFFDEREFPEGEGTQTIWWRLPPEVRAGLRLETFPLRIFPPYRDSHLVLFEVQGQSQGKAEAFRWLESHHGIPAERTIAVGDHRNDVSMLAAAGLGVAVANAVDDVRAEADIVIGHHAEDGVARWIERGAPLRDPAHGSEEPM